MLDQEIFSSNLEERIRGVQKLANTAKSDISFVFNGVIITITPDWETIQAAKELETED